MAAPRKPKRVNAAYLKKDPSEVHQGFAAYIAETTGADNVPAETVALVQRLYPLYLKSPEVVKAREAEKAAKEQAKRERLQARLDRIEAERQRVLRDLGLDPEAEVVPLRAVEEDESEPVAEVVVEAGEVEDDDEDLFEDDDEDEEEF